MDKDIISKKHLAETFGISESEMEKSMDQMVKLGYMKKSLIINDGTYSMALSLPDPILNAKLEQEIDVSFKLTD